MNTRWMLGLLALVGTVPMAGAASLTNLQGTLGTAIASAIATPDAASVDGTAAIVLYATGTVGTTPSFQCEHSGDGTNFAFIDAAKSALGPVCIVSNPVGFYRVRVTSCTGCSFNFLYRATNRR